MDDSIKGSDKSFSSELDKINLKDRMNYFYKLCKEIDLTGYTDIISEEISIEEKEFYMTLLKFFIHKEQRKLINSPFEV